MDSTSFLNNLVNRSCNSRFLGHISGDSEEPVWIALGDSIEIVASLPDINGIDFRCAIRETTLGNTKTDTAVGTGN